MTDQVLNRSSEKTALQKLQEEVSQLKKEKFEADKQRQKEMASQEVQSYVSELKSVVDESETYPLVSSFWDEAQQSVLDIQKHYAMNNQEPLTNEEVLEQVEKTYRDFMDRAVQNEKVRDLYGLASPHEEKPLGESRKVSRKPSVLKAFPGYGLRRPRQVHCPSMKHWRGQSVSCVNPDREFDMTFNLEFYNGKCHEFNCMG